VAADPMTEAQWLGSADPFPILQWAWGRLSDRRGRLLACAACRHVAHLLTDPRTTAALDASERFADGAATPGELEDAHKGRPGPRTPRGAKPCSSPTRRSWTPPPPGATVPSGTG
jgi:hypothetical protein